MGNPRVTLYSRPGCHLCDEVRARLAEIGLDAEDINIEADDRLHSTLLERIPVVEVDGRIVSELWLDEVAVRAAITSSP